eukprot:CAMPEP_0116985262 /NCGR_PEP_ID=MMETSP0467-20121206/62140_1 /TAXON_ID=283647 /ORGANISM="Mesodinium pulex, Strain SPMC105" /LENGTH=283 /DNA_ID=CAMNT_0004680525 /DNA_START=1 /DNA_END=849 /DNA_ORIENTATION=-
MSLPDIGGNSTDSGIPTAIRLRNIETNPSTGQVGFEARMYVPNDTFCSSTWYTPVHIDSLPITFLVAEKGVFQLRDEFTFVVWDDKINRTTAIFFPTGCIYEWNNPVDRCRFNTSVLVSEIGVMANIQTLVHDTYLLLRVARTQRARIQMILTPHDSLDPSYFATFGEFETVGYVAFPTGMALVCIEGVQFETASFPSITSDPFEFTYQNTYELGIPAVFGMLVTQNSLTDSTAVRVFARTETSSFAITQEDQCAEEQVVHTTPERATLFVFSFTTSPGVFCF